ncbi:sulfite exporter TauE/SafE family protein [Sulfitobacter sp. M57]|uniref:sulfite exporter TauE/SafE family protein n=1 Tax=unclassified Sulfitobacter TaxID=196795 RepID=UPI0023E0992E|nr:MULTISPECIES: sulfite exporter TauE/SafE family protein [unclassified Sulfitobacter]MDF3416179.1 sulfite exporter TauE/SafE family protein [Sulfitobacter sp. KE5]MDF3423658.1 sulfite exporter TauE/SafE family protein [Sulfitobacter sp. KE43]MDF3434725.1 sulfite exporter TauE/SafE family protein [Sulfitobacter sp. KE42]MDF3460364.1 sulfite exporter TauE/SafE family protein [Sulfitobacter sp. S74]MDF3464262.1 sulfite exporter TauE/SafE family protein [Sulfitobacter sp. Ks18]
MESTFPFLTTIALLLALCIAFVAGFVKGVVGFAQPLILISGLTLFLPPEIALAGLIIPTLVTNAMQSLRHGPQAAWASVKAYRVFLISGGITLVIAAQLVRVVPEDVLLIAIGVPAFAYAALQLAGIGFSLARRHAAIEALVGGLAGVIGGLSGVWGPPTVMYLTALGTPKADQLRVQGVIYGAGAVALFGAHLTSGVLRAETIPFSILLILPAVLGMWAGGRVVDRIDQAVFKRATLFVLLLAGANLIRRAVF